MLEYERDVDIDDYIDEGYILVRAVIEIAGSPKDFVESLMEDLKNKLLLFQLKNFPNVELKKEEIEKINGLIKNNEEVFKDKEKNAEIVSMFIDDIKEIENTPMFSGYLETELLVKDIKKLLQFAVMFTPSSIQIIEPTKLKIDNITLQDFLNETVSLLNNVFNNLKNLDAENKLLKEEIEKCRRLSQRFKK